MALMAKATPAPIRCFIIGFGDARFDETAYAAAVANRYGAVHTVATHDRRGNRSRRPPARIFDEPFGDSSALPSYAVMQLAREHVTVALSGDAGDELFAGYRRYAFHANEERLRNIFRDGFEDRCSGFSGGLSAARLGAPDAARASHLSRN